MKIEGRGEEENRRKGKEERIQGRDVSGEVRAQHPAELIILD